MFRKYPSLTNHYMERDLIKFQEMYFDKMRETRWHVGEKIHGANTSILFTPDNDVRFFSRKNDITNDMFYGAGAVYEKAVEEDLTFIRTAANIFKQSYRVFGELFGAGIQKGVDYGQEKRLLWYDTVVDDQQSSVAWTEEFFKSFDREHLLVPCFGIFDTFEEALLFDIERVTALHDNGDPDNWIEGVVIKPYDVVLEDSQGSLFYVKKKNEKFKEKQSVKKAKTATQYTEEVNQWHETFLSYIHKERLESVFSKVGRIEDIRDMGKYIHEVYKDTIETFYAEEDFPENSFTKAEKSHILNGNRLISTLLKEELKNA